MAALYEDGVRGQVNDTYVNCLLKKFHSHPRPLTPILTYEELKLSRGIRAQMNSLRFILPMLRLL